jgi:tetratricopeptide (TPR) repeat protein
MSGRLSILMDNREQARREFLRACLLEPTSGRHLQELGMSLTNLDREQQQRYFQLAIGRQPRQPERYLAYSRWLFRQGMQQEAFAVLEEAVQAVPWQLNEISDLIMDLRLPPEELVRLLPPLPAVWHELGRRLERRGLLQDAERFYRRTLALLDSLDGLPPEPVYFTRLYRLLTRMNKDDQALLILRQGIDELPDYAPFRISLGDYYRSQGIAYRAAQEYGQALRLQPANRSVQQKLQQLRLD